MRALLLLFVLLLPSCVGFDHRLTVPIGVGSATVHERASVPVSSLGIRGQITKPFGSIDLGARIEGGTVTARAAPSVGPDDRPDDLQEDYWGIGPVLRFRSGDVYLETSVGSGSGLYGSVGVGLVHGSCLVGLEYGFREGPYFQTEGLSVVFGVRF